jgi:hypothetical protein
MPVSQADIIALSSPIPVPTEMGDFRPQDNSAFTSKQQEVNAALSGVSKDPGVGLPFGDTGLIEKSGASPTSTGTTSYGPRVDFATDVVGEQVGGLVGSAPQDPDKYEAYIPEPEDEIADQTEEFVSAHEEGGIEEARKARRQDRKDDRDLRKEERDARRTELEKTMKKGKARRKSRREKRRSRRGDRRDRKQAWKNYKGDTSLEDY